MLGILEQRLKKTFEVSEHLLNLGFCQTLINVEFSPKVWPILTILPQDTFVLPSMESVVIPGMRRNMIFGPSDPSITTDALDLSDLLDVA